MIQLYQQLDLRPIGIPQTLRLSQYDSDFEIIFELTNFDGTWILDTDTTAEVQGTKTDGHGYSADAVFDDQLKTVTIAGDVQMTAAAGRNVFEVVLFHDGDRLGSKNFILDVERAALDAETTASDSKIKNFTEMTEAAEDAAETAAAAAERAEEAAASIVPGLSEEAKAALLACLRNVAWINEDGQDYYDALDAALHSGKTLTSITAVFNQGTAEIYATDTLDSLRQYLTVTANYDDGTSALITAYTLSGTLTVGTSTITAAYAGKQSTFSVTVSPTTIIIGDVSPFEIGIGGWTADGAHTGDPYDPTREYYYELQPGSNRTSANISVIGFNVGDTISIDDYSTYKYAVGTNRNFSSPNERNWATGGYTQADFTLQAVDIPDMKVILVARVDNADITQADLDYLNAHVKIIQA